MHPPRRAVCFANPNSRAARSGTSAFLGALESAGVQVELHDTESRDDAFEKLKTLPPADAILIAGGDGTISGLLPALLEREEPVGILPLGTANDFARGIGLPPIPDEVARIIAAGTTREVDVGLVNDRPFVNVASLGISVEVAGLHEDGVKQVVGRFAYPLRWVEAWRRHRPLRVDLTVDGKRKRIWCSLLAVGCGRHYGGGLTLDENARVDDGILRLYYLTPRRFYHWFRLIPSLWLGTLRQNDEAFTAVGKEIVIATRSSKRINVDGDIVGKTPATITISDKRLRVFAPSS